MKDKLRELLGELMSACEMIGYATSGNERANHRAHRDKVMAALLEILDAEGDGGADFGDADGVALRSVKVGETLTKSQWSGICQFVRHQDSIIRGLREALRNPVPDLPTHPARSGVVSAEDVNKACAGFFGSDEWYEHTDNAEMWLISMRAALEYFAKGVRP